MPLCGSAYPGAVAAHDCALARYDPTGRAVPASAGRQGCDEYAVLEALSQRAAVRDASDAPVVSGVSGGPVVTGTPCVPCAQSCSPMSPTSGLSCLTLSSEWRAFGPTDVLAPRAAQVSASDMGALAGAPRWESCCVPGVGGCEPLVMERGSSRGAAISGRRLRSQGPAAPQRRLRPRGPLRPRRTWCSRAGPWFRRGGGGRPDTRVAELGSCERRAGSYEPSG